MTEFTPARLRLLFCAACMVGLLFFAAGPALAMGTRQAAVPVLLSAQPAPVLRAAGPPAPELDFTVRWRVGVEGTGLGLSGIEIGDFDSDGNQEMILGAGYDFGRNTFWQVLEYDPATQRTVQRWRSKEYRDTINYLNYINTIAVRRPTPDQPPLIYVTLGAGIIEVYDSRTYGLAYTLNTGLPDETAMHVTDLDGDGSQELVVCNDTAMAAYSAATYDRLWTIELGCDFGVSLRELISGNLDADPAREIVTLRYVIDAATRQVEWERDFGYEKYVRVADLNNDGRDELIAAELWENVHIYDTAAQTTTLTFNTGDHIGALLVQDANGDGLPDILVGHAQTGRVNAFDGRSGAALWRLFDNAADGVNAIVLADLDHDQAAELIFASGWSSDGADRLFVYDLATRTREWYSDPIYQPLLAVDAGDVDGDGDSEVVAAPVYPGLHVYDAATPEAVWQVAAYPSGSEKNVVQVADLDGDGRPEIVIGGGDPFGGFVTAYDGLTRTEKWRRTFPGWSISTLAVADTDGDGLPEVVVGQLMVSSGVDSSYVAVLEAANGANRWRTASLGQYFIINGIAVGDINADQHPDIAFASGGYGMVYDGVTRALIAQTSFHGVSMAAIIDVTGDGVPELLFGLNDGYLLAYGGLNPIPHWELAVSNEPISSVATMPQPGAALPYLLVSDYSYAYGYDGASHAQVWRSDYVGTRISWGTKVVAKDIDGDNWNDIVLGSTAAVTVIDVGPVPQRVYLPLLFGEAQP